MCVPSFNFVGCIVPKKSVTKLFLYLKIGEKEKWRNKGMNKQRHPDSGMHNTSIHCHLKVLRNDRITEAQGKSSIAPTFSKRGYNNSTNICCYFIIHYYISGQLPILFATLNDTITNKYTKLLIAIVSKPISRNTDKVGIQSNLYLKTTKGMLEKLSPNTGGPLTPVLVAENIGSLKGRLHHTHSKHWLFIREKRTVLNMASKEVKFKSPVLFNELIYVFIQNANLRGKVVSKL